MTPLRCLRRATLEEVAVLAVAGGRAAASLGPVPAWPGARRRPAWRSAALRRWRNWPWPAAGRDAWTACCPMRCACWTAWPGPRPACVGTAVQPSAQPIHERLASAWGVGHESSRPDPPCAGVDGRPRTERINLCDARGSVDPRAPRRLRSGGPRGAGRPAAWWHDRTRCAISWLIQPWRQILTASIAIRLARGERIPAFGHPLYPNGDPRAARDPATPAAFAARAARSSRRCRR